MTYCYDSVTKRAYAKGSARTAYADGGQLHTREGKRAIVGETDKGAANFITSPDGYGQNTAFFVIRHVTS